MNRKVFSVALGVLLTCIVRAHKVSAFTTTTEYYDSTDIPAGCKVVCNKSDYEDEECEEFILVANVRSNLLAFYNTSGKAAFILDLENDLVVLVNRATTSRIVIDVKEQRGAYISCDESKIKKESFREYLSSLNNGLKYLLTLKNAVQFEVGQASSQIRNEANEILKNLIFDISKLLKNNPGAGIELASLLGTEFLRIQKGPLNGYTRLVGVKGVTLQGDLARANTVQKGLAEVFGRVPGYGIPAHLRAGARIDLQKLADAQNGIDLLTILIRQISSVTDVGKILGDLLKEPEPFFKLLRLLGGNQNLGVDGVVKVASAIIEYIERSTPLENVINVIIQFLYFNSEEEIGSEEIARKAKKSLSNLIKAIDQAGCEDSLSGALQIAKAFRDRELVVKNVEVSKVTRRLALALDEPIDLQVLVNILQELEEIIRIEKSLPRLLLVLIINVNSPYGIDLLRGVGIQIDINIDSVSGGILQYILRSVSNIENSISRDLYKGLCAIPVLEKIIIGLKSAVSECGIETSLRDILEEDQSSADLIKAVLQVEGGINLKVPDGTCSDVRQTLQRCSSIAFYVNIQIRIKEASE